MQTTSLLTDDGWSSLLRRLPQDIDLDGLARRTKALRRRRGVPDAATLLRLALMVGPGGLSLRAAASWAGIRGIATLTDPSLNDRLHGANDFLKAIVGCLLAKRVMGTSRRWPGRCLRLADGSSLTEPGGIGTDWRLHAVLDLERGGFSHLDLTDGHGGEALDRGAAVPGEIRLADRNYGQAKALHRFITSVGATPGADYVVRLRWSSLRLRREDGRAFTLIGHLKSLPADQAISEVTVLIDGGPAGAAPLRARVIVMRKPPEATEAERKRLRHTAHRLQKKLDDRSLIAAEYMMLATSLPADQFPAAQVMEMYRFRWQIELAFKRLKSILHLDRLPCTTEQGSKTWIYAHLILALLLDDLTQDFLESSPSAPA
jgi:hypothetical protein